MGNILWQTLPAIRRKLFLVLVSNLRAKKDFRYEKGMFHALTYLF